MCLYVVLCILPAVPRASRRGVLVPAPRPTAAGPAAIFPGFSAIFFVLFLLLASDFDLPFAVIFVTIVTVGRGLFRGSVMVGVVGSRSLPSSFSPLVASVVRA